MKVQELRPGLWRWTARHPDWGHREVNCSYLETPDAVVLVDPLVPSDEEERFFRALDADVERLGLPVAIALTSPWHRRSADELAQRYRADIHVGGYLESFPGGMHPNDVVLYAASHGALFTGDTIVDGELCPEGWLSAGRDHQIESLRALLDLDADLVVPSHGAPFGVERLAQLLHSPPSAA
jgi:glyoxylase-like metal-dependent hydrolase (beta-lactamase superfamily II)